MSAKAVSSVGWRREEDWFDGEVAWFDEGGVVAAFVLPPLPRFEGGLAASRARREAWKRRRRTRATMLMVLPAVMVPPALIRSGGAGAGIIAEDPPSLTFTIGGRGEATQDVPAAPRPKWSRDAAADVRSEAFPEIEWRNATSVGLWFGGSLVEGTQLPIEGKDWVTWNPVTDSVPNAPGRLYGNERTIRTLLAVIEDYRAANPDAPRVVVGDISFEHGGPMDAHVSHQSGLDVDIYYPRLDGGLRAPRLTRAIDRRLSQDLLDRFVAAGAHMVFVGYHTGLRGPEKIVIPYPNHEDHMHVRFPRR
jgi:Penicillin-insensitive murein endopeptidase